MSQPEKKQNGRKLSIPMVCPHTEDCAAPKMHEQLMLSLDGVSAAVGDLRTATGELLEEHGRLLRRIEQVHEEALDRAKTYNDCNEYILATLRRLEQGISLKGA